MLVFDYVYPHESAMKPAIFTYVFAIELQRTGGMWCSSSCEGPAKVLVSLLRAKSLDEGQLSFGA